MNRSEQQEIADLLDERRAEVSTRITALDANLETIRSARGDAAGADDEHDPEGATASGEWSTLAGLRRDATVELAALADAREHLERGEYGLCVECGVPIPIERLYALPAATLCISCAARRR